MGRQFNTQSGTRVGVRSVRAWRDPKRGRDRTVTPGIERWDQGFATIFRSGNEYVPFSTESTTRAVARRAARRTKQPMFVQEFPDGLWGYRRK